MTLTEFLLARIAENEAVALAATPGPWTPDEEGCCVYTPETGIMAQVAIGGGDGTEADVDHIVRHDPGRVLAECTALREVVEGIVPERDPYRDHPDYDPEWALRSLAAVYADHPDYRQEWRP